MSWRIVFLLFPSKLVFFIVSLGLGLASEGIFLSAFKRVSDMGKMQNIYKIEATSVYSVKHLVEVKAETMEDALDRAAETVEAILCGNKMPGDLDINFTKAIKATNV